jgi:hypothetical protein
MRKLSVNLTQFIKRKVAVRYDLTQGSETKMLQFGGLQESPEVAVAIVAVVVALLGGVARISWLGSQLAAAKILISLGEANAKLDAQRAAQKTLRAQQELNTAKLEQIVAVLPSPPAQVATVETPTETEDDLS